MQISPTELADVLLVQYDVHRDGRGWFQELWNPARIDSEGLPTSFVQDNAAYSKRGVLRGLHFQKEPFAQGKLVTVLSGEVFDVAVDVRVKSPTYGRWTAQTLAGGSGRALYIPEGFAHGYQVLSDDATVLYKCTEVYHPEAELALAWNDQDLAIAWPLDNPLVSPKDQQAPMLRDLRAQLIG